MRPSDLLAAAADRIRDLAAAASTDQPWHAGDIEPADGKFYGQYGDFGWYVSGPAGSPEFADSEQGLADARWVAALSPAVAEPLQAILREAARQVEIAAAVNGRGEQADRYTESKFANVLALARSISGVGVGSQ